MSESNRIFRLINCDLICENEKEKKTNNIIREGLQILIDFKSRP